MSIVSPHAAYRRTLEDYPDIEELLERSRERRRANDAAAVEDAQEVMEQFTTPRPSPPAVVHPATRPDEGTNSWGRAIGEALGRVGGAVVNKIVNKPEPEAPAVEPPLPTPTFTPPSPPAEPGTLPSLRPVDSSDQLADAHEQPQGRDGLRPATSPPLAAETADARRRRLALVLDPARMLRPSPVSEGVPMTAAPRFRPEDFKPSRRLPAPGEEAANDARMNARLEEVGVYDDRRAVETFRDGMERARVARPREFLERRIAEIETNPTRQNGNSRLVGALKSAGYGALQGFARTGNLAGAAGGAITGGTIGAVDDTADERLSEQRQVEIMRAGLQQMYGREAAGLKLDDARAGVRLKNEQADYYGQKPEAEAAKREAQRVKDERARIFRVLGALKGQQLDPNDERVQQLQRDADRADIPFDVGSFNNSKGNLVRYTRTDPEHPERTVEVERNVVTGEESVLGQRGFQPTRDAQGNTTSQNASIEDRRKLLGLRARNIELEIQNKERELSTGIPASASRAFSTATAGLSAQLAQKRQQIAALRKSALELTADPVEAEARADALEVEANEILERMEAVRAQTLGGGSSSAVARASGRFSGKKTPRSRLPEFARRWGVSEAEAEQRIKDEGGTVY